ncbi:MAG TPA: 50S ribosomal protein L15 [Terriglobales bacterium]|nr:50S ribosomal protein L15 [Terriglobales bacterium]
MNLSSIRAPKKANEKKKRIGRGMGSGMGKTSTRGHKGQGSRSGSRLMRGFEGGQMPLHRRMPKRGFVNIFRVEYTVVNLNSLATLDETTITPEVLRQRGLVSDKRALVKILGDGELSKPLTVQAHKFSKSAQEKIEKAGGKAEVIRLHHHEEHTQTKKKSSK